ncbi:MAG: DNA-3-methyladenine glycosylase 2 [Candidatus Methanoperedens sp.]|nr:DNA-3-methyladenine glycosylase 2 [Candidatus Methanoperedens sp.]MCZ7368945.1 DNA-3-methyladenine glycosylase 2 [Candidatus Methanoperedens sp.]
MEMKITPSPPFDFELSSIIFSDGDAQYRRYENGKFWQVIRLDGKLILITVTSTGNVDKPQLSIELSSSEEITYNDRKLVEEFIVSIFNLDFDLEQFYESIKNDKLMSTVARRLRGLRSPTTQTVFESLVDSIVEQQISLKAAHTIQMKMIKNFGDNLKIGNRIYYAFPEPQKLASLNLEMLKRCGLSLKKSEYIGDISRSITEGNLDLENFKNHENTKEIIEELCKIRGIGIWTAELTMIRGMHKLESFPADDIGLRRIISHYYCNDKEITAMEGRRIAENWGKWKGLAGYYLLIAEKLGIKI